MIFEVAAMEKHCHCVTPLFLVSLFIAEPCTFKYRYHRLLTFTDQFNRWFSSTIHYHEWNSLQWSDTEWCILHYDIHLHQSLSELGAAVPVPPSIDGLVTL